MDGGQTFPRIHRISRSGDYQRLWREGSRYHSAHFVMLVAPGQDVSRLGLTVSRKVGNAVCRNRLKRWLREFFRQNDHHVSRAVDISIIAKRDAGRLSHCQVDRELTTLFARLETVHHD